MRVGLSLLNFETAGPSEQRFSQISEVAAAAERMGVFASLWVGDHLDHVFGGPMLDAFSLLGALAAGTNTITLGVLVAAVTFRHPAVIARSAVTLDAISRGRFVLGLGAGVMEREHRVHGIRFPPGRQRLERLEEAAIVCRRLLVEDRVEFRGRYYRLDGASLNPRPLQAGRPRILIGGKSDRALRVAAERGDAANLTYPSLGQIRERFGFLETCVLRAGRLPGSVSRTTMTALVVGRTAADTRRAGDAFRSRRGMDLQTFEESVLAGEPEAVRERVAAIEAAGVDELYVGLPTPYDRAALEAATEVLSPWARSQSP